MNKCGHYIMIKGSIQENITIVNTDMPKNRPCLKLCEIKNREKLQREINKSSNNFGDFKTSFRNGQHKENSKETVKLNNTIRRLDIINILHYCIPNNSRMHCLLKLMWNSLKRLYSWPQNTFNKFKGIKQKSYVFSLRPQKKLSQKSLTES